MQHRLSFVAESRFFDADEFLSFAEGKEVKYGLVTYKDGSEPTVSTWHVDAMCRDFVEAGGQRIAPTSHRIQADVGDLTDQALLAVYVSPTFGSVGLTHIEKQTILGELVQRDLLVHRAFPHSPALTHRGLIALSGAAETEESAVPSQVPGMG